MSSLYAKYVAEREGLQAIEDDLYFLTYEMKDSWLLVHDFYIVPEYRGGVIAKAVLQDLKRMAMEYKKTSIRATVETSLPDASTLVMLYIRNGFKIINADNGLILIEMEI